MSFDTPLDAMPLWGLAIITLLAILAAFESGYRLGRWRRSQTDEEKEAPVSGMVAAELGLLAFMLAFTFGLAASRYDDRRQALLSEANAIGTAYLRTAMLPEPQRAESRDKLRHYVDVRLSAVATGDLEDKIRQSEELHGRLWSAAVSAAESDPRSVPIGLYVQALNEVIDLHAKRVTVGLRSRIPMPVWLVLSGVAVLSFGAMGYHTGLVGTRRSPAVLVVCVTFAAVLMLVADLDRPGHGLLMVSQQPMKDLRSSMGG